MPAMGKTDYFSVCFYLLLVIFITDKCFKIIQYPIYIDEANTYLFFTSHSLEYIAITYTSTNNHILYSLLANAFAQLLPENPFLVMRFLNLIFAGLTLLLFFQMVKQYYNPAIALLSAIVLSVCFPFILYTIYGRGYMLTFFLMTLSLRSFLVMISSPGEARRQFIWFALFNALGMYAIPSYAYALVSFLLCACFFLVIHKKYWLLRYLIYSSLLMGIMTFIFYSPIILKNGFGYLLNTLHTSYGEPVTGNEKWNYFYRHFDYIFNYLTGVNALHMQWIFFLILLVVLFKARNNPDQLFAGIALLFFAITPAFYLAHPILPPSRVWAYLSIPLAMGAAVVLIIFHRVLKNERFFNYIILFVSVVLITWRVLRFTSDYSKNEIYIHDSECRKIAYECLNRGYHHFVCSEHTTYYESAILQCYYDLSGKEISVTKEPGEETECFIINKTDKSNYSMLNQLVLIYENKFVEVYAGQKLNK